MPKKKASHPWQKSDYYKRALLGILFKCSGGKACVPVPRDLVESYLLQYCGINPKRLPAPFDTMKSLRGAGGPFHRARSIVYNPERHGYIVYTPGRNLYALTDKGIEAAREAASQPWQFRDQTPQRLLGKRFGVPKGHKPKVKRYTPTDEVLRGVRKDQPEQGRILPTLKRASFSTEDIKTEQRSEQPSQTSAVSFGTVFKDNARDARSTMRGATHSERFHRLIEESTYRVMTEMLPLMQKKIMEAVMTSLDDFSRSRERINYTREFLSKQDQSFFTAVENSMSKSSRLTLSRDTSLIGEHLQEYLAQAVACDKFRKPLKEGKKITASMVANWAIRSAFSQMRAWGSDGAVRASQGALTEKEVKARREEEDGSTATVSCGRTHSKEVVYSAHAEDSSSAPQIRDFVDPDDEFAKIERREEVDVMLKKAEEILLRNAPSVAVNIFRRLFIQGDTRDEIMASEGITSARFNTMRIKINTLLMKAAESGELDPSRLN